MGEKYIQADYDGVRTVYDFKKILSPIVCCMREPRD